MESKISESNGELREGLAVENLTQSILRQPLIMRRQELPRTSQIFEFEEEEDDLDLFDDGENEYYEDEIYKLVQSYVPTSRVSVVVENHSMNAMNAALTHHFEVPSNLADCFNELEKKMIDLNEEGTVKKEVIRPGNGIKVPESSRLYYHYMAIVEGHAHVWDRSVTQKYPKFTDFKNTTNLVDGFVAALRSMEIKEVARFLVYPTMAYGEVGCPPFIPANVKIIYVVETLHYIDEEKLNTPLYMTLNERSDLPFQTVYEVAYTLCFEGNRWYDAPDYQLAIKKWQKGIQLLEEYPSANASDEECKKKSQLCMSLYSNTAQAYLKLEKPAQACNACQLGLQLSQGETSTRLLYRFSKAKLMLKDCDGALQLVEEGLKLSMKDPDLRRLEHEIYLEDAYQRGASKSVWAGNFNSSPRSSIEISPHQGPSGAVKGSELKMKGAEEKSLPKGSPAKAFKTLFSKKKTNKK